MEDNYLKGLETERRRIALKQAVKVERQAIDANEREPNDEEITERAERFLSFLRGEGDEG